MATSATLKKRMLEALEKSLGIVTIAAKAANINRITHYKWMNKDPKYKAAVVEIEEVALDFAESKLHNLITKANPAATIFYLKTKGKKRGYIEQIDFGGNGLNKIIVKAPNANKGS